MKDVLEKGPSSSEEDEDQPTTEEGEGMETQTEKRKDGGKKTKTSVSKALDGKKKTREADWYDKDTRFVATPDRTEYKANSKSRPALAYAALAKPGTMAKIIDRFCSAMEESGLAKEQRIGNLQGLADRWIPSYVKWLIEKKAARSLKEGEEYTPVATASKGEKTEKKEKSKKKKKQAEATK
jgi:hypothetical protein